MSEFAKDAEAQSDGSAWGAEYLKSVPEFAGEKKFIKLEELADFCNLENSMIFGHGTASSGNGHEVVESIFEEGIKGWESGGSIASEDRGDEAVGSTDLTNNSIILWNSIEGEPNFDKMKGELDNWSHRSAENVILMRLPVDYYHMETDVAPERTQAYFTQHEDKDGQLTNYLDRRLIIGNYNAKTGVVEINPHFEAELSEEFKEELAGRLAEVQEQTKKRHEEQENNPFGLRTNEAPETDETASAEWANLDASDWDSADWE